MAILLILSAIILQISAQVLEFQQGYEVNKLRNDTGHFKWFNCDQKDLPLTFLSLSVKPDPLQVRGERVFITFQITFGLTENIGTKDKPIELDISLRLKTSTGFTDICNLVGDSFCHFNDLCAYLHTLAKECEQYGIQCNCPILARKHSLPPLTVNLTNPLPFLLKGTFAVTIRVKQMGKHVGCLEIHFCVNDCLF